MVSQMPDFSAWIYPAPSRTPRAVDDYLDEVIAEHPALAPYRDELADVVINATEPTRVEIYN